MSWQTSTELEPKVWVACLAAYNHGVLHGKWVDVDDDEDALNEAIAEVLRTSPIPNAEEHAFHDYDEWGGLEFGEYERVATLCEMATLLRKHGPAFVAYAQQVIGSTKPSDLTGFEEEYQGEHKSRSEFTAERFTDSNDIPDHLQPYIDWDAVDSSYDDSYVFVEVDHDRTFVFNR